MVDFIIEKKCKARELVELIREGRMKYLGDCEINEMYHRKDDWAYIEDYMFNPDGTMVIIGMGYHTYERCGFVLVVLKEWKE